MIIYFNNDNFDHTMFQYNKIVAIDNSKRVIFSAIIQ